MDSKVAERDRITGKPFPVVGIGASAGGLEAFEAFLSEVPEDFGFAIVFIQHLSPKHESLLPDLLRSRKPELEIVEIPEGIELLPGKVYICPPGKEVTIEKGAFHVSSRSEGHIHLPIDDFFTSLAKNFSERAIAVVLSGAGTDGASGIQAVRKVGGTVFVQDPSTAEYSGMPLAAIDTEVMDAVLSPVDIAREILKLHGSDVASAADLASVADFEAFYRVISERTGYRFNHYKKSVVARRIRRRMYLDGVSSMGAYLEMLAKSDSEALALASDLMIGVTSFFRDKLSWKALHLEVTRKLALDEDDTPIRVWTPACATGEEAYSIVMTLQAELDTARRRREIQVFATDVNDRALERAREGTYPASVVSDIPPEYLTKFFTPSEDSLSLIVSKDIRQRIVFAHQDLLTDPPFSRLDLVVCRNLLIYLEPDAQEKCMALFHYALKPGGHLFLGNAESPGRGNTLFTVLAHKKCRVYRKVELKEPARLPLTVPFAAEHTPAPARQTGSDFRQPLMEFIHQALLEEFAPASVVITQAFDIVFNTGATNRYLRQPYGTPTQNFLELLPKHLHNRMRAGLFRAAQEMKPVSIRTNMADEGGRKRQVAIRISKLRENTFLVTFREKSGLVEEAGSPEGSFVEETAARQLESELSATRETLQSNVEQLKSLNEELQSSNEELQAANEELETSREELQSLNEELVAVNSQLQTKIEEQEETNNDLNNLLTSTSIPTIFLDDHFRVKRFTPAMSKLIKLIASDVGRPIVDMSRENLGPDLILDAQSVLDQLVPIRREFMVNDGWYVRTTLPYRTSNNRIEGVVVTYTDITERKRAELSLSESEERLRLLVEGVHDYAIFMLDEHGRVASWNAGAERLKGWKEHEILGQHFSRFYPPELIEQDLPRREIEAASATGQYHEEGQRLRKDGSRFWADVTITALRAADGRLRGFAKLTRDITDRKTAEEALRESETRYRGLFETARRDEEQFRVLIQNLRSGVALIDETGKFAVVNPAFLEMLGLDSESSILNVNSQDWSRWEVYGEDGGLLHVDDHPVRKAAITGKPVVNQLIAWRNPRVDELRWMLINAEPLKREDGSIYRVICTYHDITERKAAEETVRESEKRYRSLFDNMLNGFAYCRMLFEDGRPADFIYLDTNNAFEVLTGLKDVVGKRVSQVIPGIRKSDPGLFEIYGRVALTGVPEQFETHLEALGMWFSISVYSPEREYFVAVFDVITARKKAEAELANDVSALTRLHELSTSILEAGRIEATLQKIMDAAVEIVAAQHGTLQLLEGESLRIVAHHNHTPPFLGFFEHAENRASVCREALKCGERMIVEDVESSQLFAGTSSLPVFREAGIRAVQSTPIASRTGQLIGVLTTHWDHPYKPDERDLWRIDLLARQAADLIEQMRSNEELRKSRDELEIRVEERTAELEKERQRLFDVLETVPAMVCLLTPDHHIIFSNRSFREKFGEPQGRHCYEFCFGKSEPCDFCESYKVLETGKPHHWEVTTPDGASIIDAYDFPFTDVDGSPLILEMDIDITDQRRAEEALRRQGNLIDLAYEAMLAWDLHGPIFSWNSGASRLYGFTEQEAVGQVSHDLLKTVFPASLEETLSALEQKGVFTGELVHTKKDGTVITVETRMQTIADASGKQIVLEINRDITERKQAEKALRSAYAYNRSLIEASLDPLVTIDREGCISDVNVATEQATGYSRDELIGADFSDYFTDPEKARAGYRKVFDEGFVRDYPLDIRHRDGRITPVLYNAAVYRDDTGSAAGVFAAARDISEQQKLEAQLRQAQKMEALGTLSGGIAHDFNNMLAAIIGFTELIKDHSGEESRDRHHAQRVLDAAARGRELVRQMLTFSRRTEQEKKPLRLSSIVKESAQLLRASIPSTVRIRVSVKSDSGLILADPTQTQQVVVNLATNAAYAMRQKGGTLDIEISDFSISPSMPNPHDMEPGLYMKLTVRDTGIGISSEIMDRIFDPFFTTKSVGEGTGLGLSVVLGIVKQAHGYVTVESEPGKGSTFDVYFPKIMEESMAQEAVGDETIPLGRERILFVDDEEALVEMGEELLAELGYEVTCRKSSREALALFKLDPSRFDLVITDQTMPEMAGIQLAAELLAVRPEIPIILCTGFSHAANEESARAAGIKGFVMKPLTKREIARAVRQVLDG